MSDEADADSGGEGGGPGDDATTEQAEGETVADVAAGADGESVEPPAELVERVAESDPETVAAELAALRERGDAAEAALADCEAERDDLESRLKRKQADFENYKKRMEKRRQQEKRRATEDLVERLLDVRDNLLRATEQDADADVRSGVETTLAQFDEVLAAENVETIEPAPGDPVDPQRHEVLMRVESDRESGTVAELHRPGYEMADTVLRPAQVTVSDDE